MVEMNKHEHALLVESDVKLTMLRDGMRRYMEIWRADSEPTLSREFMTVLRSVFPYDYEETLAKLRKTKMEEEAEK